MLFPIFSYFYPSIHETFIFLFYNRFQRKARKQGDSRPCSMDPLVTPLRRFFFLSYKPLFFPGSPELPRSDYHPHIRSPHVGGSFFCATDIIAMIFIFFSRKGCRIRHYSSVLSYHSRFLFADPQSRKYVSTFSRETPIRLCCSLIKCGKWSLSDLLLYCWPYSHQFPHF